mgnify:CR=1 FL=1
MGAIDIGYQKEIISGPDSIIIRHYGDGIKGGKVLDMTGIDADVVGTEVNGKIIKTCQNQVITNSSSKQQFNGGSFNI